MNYELFNRLKFCFKELNMNKEQIARELNLSSTTVRKWLKLEKYPQRSYGQRGSKIDPFKERVDELLKICPDYSGQQVLRMIKSEGFKGSRSLLNDYLQKIRPKAKKAFLTLNFPPGNSAQVDWGLAGYLKIGNKRRKVSYFVMVLCYSRMMFVKFTLSEAQEAWSECHKEAFEYFGGVSKKVVVDNCKTAVISHKSGESVVFNNRYLDLANHYGFEIVACNVRQPQEKGRVENGVGYVRKNFLNGRKLAPFDLLNIEVREWLDYVANLRIHGTTNRKPFEMHKEENLHKLPIHPYDCTRKVSVKINKMYRVRFDSNTYSVPAEYIYEDATIEASLNKIRIWAKNRVIAEHQRCFERGVDISDQQHDKILIQHRKRAEEQKMIAWLLKLTYKAEEFCQKLNSRSLRPVLEYRKLFALGQIYNEREISQAIEDALKFNACSAAYVQNILEQKELNTVGPLHVPHKTDLLKITLNSPNINIYEGR